MSSQWLLAGVLSRNAPPVSPLWPPSPYCQQDNDSSPGPTPSDFSLSSRGPGTGTSRFTTPENQESQHFFNTMSVSHSAQWMDPIEERSDGPMTVRCHSAFGPCSAELKPFQASSSSCWNSAISSADHQSLLSNNNTAYTQLLDAHSQLLSRHQEIQHDYQGLKVRFESVMYVLPLLLIYLELRAMPSTRWPTTNSFPLFQTSSPFPYPQILIICFSLLALPTI